MTPQTTTGPRGLQDSRPPVSRRTWLRAAGIGALTPAWLAGCGGGDPMRGLQPDQLTLEQKIGQMVLMGFAGTLPDGAAALQVRRQIEAGRLGGVVFYRYNVTGPEQLQALTSTFEAANPLTLPLLQAVDQEGGLVQRLRASNGFFDTPSAEAVAATQSLEQAYDTWRRMADMLRSAGLTFNLAPVVDLRGDPADPTGAAASPVIGQLQRSFSSDPATVVAYARRFIAAHHDAGLRTALKHFPGHGLAGTDTHLGFVDITRTQQPVEREPFRQLVRAGLADAVMTGHLVHRGIDADLPLSLSPRYLERELRGADGFDGLMLTDDLHNGAVVQHYALQDTVIRAIQAGNDVLLFSNNPLSAPNVPGFAPQFDVAEQVIRIVMRAIERGELTPQRIDQSWRRLAALRGRHSV